jgi:hypothetical protein
MGCIECEKPGIQFRMIEILPVDIPSPQANNEQCGWDFYTDELSDRITAIFTA